MDTQNPSSDRFYENEKNVREYIESREGIDGRSLIDILKKHLKPRSNVLELGMGAGKDLNILNETYKTTGSDYSQAFINIYKQNNRNADLILLDAITLKTNRKFDCIYSNKVLHHLSQKDLKRSLKRQIRMLRDDGILFHTFWHGNKSERFDDLNFVKYRIDELSEIISVNYKIIDVDLYEEMNINDSIYIILKPH